jgi:hypothetical protein
VAITNGYCTLAELKEALFEGTTSGTVADTKLERTIETASRKIDTHCGRRFWQDATATARAFSAWQTDYVGVDDFWTTTGLIIKLDDSRDGSFATTVASGFQLEPINGLSAGSAWAYTGIRATGSTVFVRSNQALVQVTAKWGWPEVPGPVRDACIIQSVALLSAAKTPFGVAGLGDMGVMRVKSGLHPTAEELCSDYIVMDGMA